MVNVRQIRVTPKIATWMLERNTRNRNIRDRTVRAFAEDMRTGKWNGLNGETIKVTDDGQLLDGQHRLWAVVQAEVEVDLLVAYGVPEDSQDTVDTGMRRTFADTLHLRGEVDPINLASITKRVYVWELNGTRETPSHKNPHTTTPQLDETLAKHPELRDVRRDAGRFYDNSHALLPTSAVGLLMWVFSGLENAEEDVPYFFGRLADGQELTEGNPIYALRKKLLENKQSVSRLNDRVALAFVIKAWNAYRDGEALHVLRFKPGGAKPERFPIPR